MPSPFPGTDLYLEEPGLWPDVHHELISVSREMLNRQLRPKYHVRVEERVYISDENDQDEIHEARLEVIDRAQRLVVTVIEVLSPTNKVAGSRGRASYEEKRSEVMISPSHFVEIDLLRSGVAMFARETLPPHDYLAHISRKDRRPKGLLWPILLTQRLPVIPIPLKPPDPDAPLDLQEVLSTAYDRAAYDLEIDYGKAPVPPLDESSSKWADDLLRAKGLR
jgi:hypothetical protein